MKIKTLLKRTVVLSLVTALLAFGLTGCGNQESGTKDATSATNETKAEVTTVSEGAKEDETEVETKDEAEDTVDTSELKPFRVGCGDAQTNQLNDLAAVAQRKGYLEEELNNVGFTLQVTGFQGQGPEINAALMSGSLDAGNYAEFPALTSKASGADTTVVAISDPHLSYGILTGSEDIKTLKDLEGKKIIVQQGTVLQYVWEQVTDEAGVDKEKVEVINSNVADGISLIQTGDADALLSSSNSLKNFENKGIGHLIEGFPDSAYSLTLFNFSNEFLKESPEVAVAVNKALIRAYKDVVADPQIFYDILGEKYGDGGAEIIEATYTINSSLEYLNPEYDEELKTGIRTIYDWMNAHSLLASEVDLDTYFDSSYFQQATEELGE